MCPEVPNWGRGVCCAHQSGHFGRHKCLFLDNFAKHDMDRIDIMKKLPIKIEGISDFGYNRGALKF